jgi:hypothetical protein
MRSFTRLSFAVLTAFFLSVCFSSTQIALAQFLGNTKIIFSEFRFDGPNGVGDEFVEIVNNANFAQTIVSSDANNTKGWSVLGLVAGSPRKICTIPFGTVLAPGQHYLCAKVPGYELGGYSQGQDDNIANYTAFGLDADGGVALFSSEDALVEPDGRFFSSAGIVYREDAVGFKKLISASFDNSFAPAFREPYVLSGGSAGLNPIGAQDPANRAPKLTNDVREYSFLRKHVNVGGFGRWNGPTYQDSNINTADWVLVSNLGDLMVNQAFVANSTTNTFFPGSPFDPSPVLLPKTELVTTPIFGAPGPQSKASPIERNYNTRFLMSLFDPGSLAFKSPNRVQNITSIVCGGPQGDLILRFTYKNLTGSAQNLRVRWIELSTINRNNTVYTGVLNLLDSTGPTVKTLGVIKTWDITFPLSLANDPPPTGDGITNANPPGEMGPDGIKRVRSTYVEGVNKTPPVAYVATAPPPGFGGPLLGPGVGTAIQVFAQVNPTWTDLNASAGTPCRVGGLNSATVAKPPTGGVTTTALPAPIVPGGSISLEHRFGIIKSGGFAMMGIIESN